LLPVVANVEAGLESRVDALVAYDAEVTDPDIVIPPVAIILPDTTSEPVTIGKYWIIIDYFLIRLFVIVVIRDF
jgi:hypothetical protein